MTTSCITTFSVFIGNLLARASGFATPKEPNALCKQDTTLFGDGFL